jgi:CDP-glycerol glycerophosphotransferase (TagB/SpsB family)/glycosyltransferase involved in cell wall biosynthesis
MTWLRDPRPGITWRAKRLRGKARKRVTRLRKRLATRRGTGRSLDEKTRFRLAWGGHFYDRPVDRHVVVYESFAGTGALCNPRAIFDELLGTRDMAHLRHVWCFANLTVKREFDKRFARHPRVRSVLIGTVEYYRLLATAGYLVNNQTFPPDFVKRPEQVYLNTWHGTPCKTMGYESPEGPVMIRNTVRNFLCADYLLSPSEFATRVLYERGYRLAGIYRGTVVEEGYPRLDAQFTGPREEVREELRAAGVGISGETLVLYAPTWRGRSFHRPVLDVVALRSDVESLAERLGPGYTVLLKVHQQVFDVVARDGRLAGRLVPNSLAANRLLGAVDALVTDYSSIFFDFLATGRPVIFYVPDAAGYERERGVLLGPDELPGPTYAEVSGVAAGIRAIGSGSGQDPLVTHGGRYREAAACYCPADDGRATARVIDVVFRGRTQGYRLRRGLPDERTSILISMGRSRTSGVNTALVSLLKNLDPSHYDVTLLVQPPKEDRERELQALIPAPVRQLVRVGTFPITAERMHTHNAFLATGLTGDGTFPGDEARLLAAEWRHSLGLSAFDHVIDFSGYTPFWPGVLLQGQAGTSSIWLHNDMLADSRRGADDNRFVHKGLPATFTLYRHFDNLVSVSPALAQINAETLCHLAAPEKFRSAHNTIDAERIRSLAGGSTASGAADAPDIPVAGVPLPDIARRLVRSCPPEAISAEVARQVSLACLLSDRGQATTFVTVGRLSPEKNHARMIRAFARVYAERPETRLLIIGTGPLESELRSLADRLGIGHAVTLAGYQANPYALMAASDCFVLSSDYEGQPMVLLEALSLGLPVVTVDFGSAASALPGGCGLAVPQTDDGLASGLRAFLRGEVSTGGFDAAGYNALAVTEFAAAIGTAARSAAAAARQRHPAAA